MMTMPYGASSNNSVDTHPSTTSCDPHEPRPGHWAELGPQAAEPEACAAAGNRRHGSQQIVRASPNEIWYAKLSLKACRPCQALKLYQRADWCLSLAAQRSTDDDSVRKRKWNLLGCFSRHELSRSTAKQSASLSSSYPLRDVLNYYWFVIRFQVREGQVREGLESACTL